MDEQRVAAFKAAGLDHIQISFQASDKELNNYLAGTDSFQHKVDMARIVKKYEYPMVLNIVIHRQNIDQIEDIINMTAELNADYVELASTQYYGWSKLNVAHLLPTREQLERAEKIAHEYQEKNGGFDAYSLRSTGLFRGTTKSVHERLGFDLPHHCTRWIRTSLSRGSAITGSRISKR